MSGIGRQQVVQFPSHSLFLTGNVGKWTEVDEATARDCLQSANWDLPRAIEEYVPGDDGTRAPDFTGLKDRLGVITGG